LEVGKLCKKVVLQHGARFTRFFCLCCGWWFKP